MLRTTATKSTTMTIPHHQALGGALEFGAPTPPDSPLGTAAPRPRPRLFHTLIGRLGNQLFQYSSVVGIAALHGMTPCIKGGGAAGGGAAAFFDGIAIECNDTEPTTHVDEDGKYGTYNQFSFVGDTVLDGYLESYKYFLPNFNRTIRFKPHILADSQAFLATFLSPRRTTIGMHVRRGDVKGSSALYPLRDSDGLHYTYYSTILKYGKKRRFDKLPKTNRPKLPRLKHDHIVYDPYGYREFPGDKYFTNVLAHFRTKYSNAQFVVVSDDPTWCSTQPFFMVDDVSVVLEKHIPAVAMAILAGCDHMVLTVGSFGWWAAYLGAGAKGGEVVYYDSVYKMKHPTNKGNVVLRDVYPDGWMAMGTTNQTRGCAEC